MGVAQSTILGNEHVIRNIEIQDTFTTSDPILGVQRYITLIPGIKAKVQSTEDFGTGVVLLIVTERDNNTQSQILRLTHQMKSLAGVSPSRIFIPMIVDGTPEMVSLSDIS